MLKILFLFIFSFNLYASSDQELLDQAAYSFTLRLCNGPDIVSKLNLFKESLIETIDLTIIEDSLSESRKNDDFRIATSSSFRALVSSTGFYKGLDKCYGDSRVKKDLLFFSILSADISGKMIGGIGHILIYKIGGFLFSAAKSLLPAKVFYPMVIGITGGIGYSFSNDLSDSQEFALRQSSVDIDKAYQSLENNQIDEKDLGDEIVINLTQSSDRENDMLRQLIEKLESQKK